jgi:hypothetical protein
MWKAVPYEREKHGAFVESTFAASVGQAHPWGLVPPVERKLDLQRNLRRPGFRCAVAVMAHDPDSYLGWAAADRMSNTIVYAYTLAAYRTPAPDKRNGFEPRVATTLLAALGIDFSKPTRLYYWTPAAMEIAKRPGYQLVNAR